MKSNLFKKFMEFGIGSIATLLLGFITSPIITRIISPEQNGKFSIFNTITNLLMIIIILGLDQSYVRYYYEEEEGNRGSLLRRCIKLPILINGVAAVIILLFYKSISLYIVQDESFFVAILICMNLFLSIVSRFAMLQIRMKQKGKLYSMLNVISKIVNLIFVILVFFIYKDNYMTLILSTVLTNFLITFIAVFSERNEWRTKGKSKLRVTQHEILKYGVPLVFSMAITWIFQSIDRISIKEFSGFYELGLYNGAMTIIALLNAVQSTFTTFWVPVAFERYSKNPNDVYFFEKINRIITIAMFTIAIILISSKDLIVMLLGPKYRDAVFIFPYLVFMPIMYTISETTVLGINFLKKPKYHIHIAMYSAISNVLGNIILVPRYGATGAAISTGLSYIVFFATRTYYSVRLYKVNYGIAEFSISTALLFMLATYSSFHKFDVVIVLLSLVNIISIMYLYKDTIRKYLIVLWRNVLNTENKKIS